MNNLIRKSIYASICIGFGVIVLLSAPAPIGTFLFSFGLLSVCHLNGNLFTGKAGYYWKDNLKELVIILIINLLFGYLIGFLFSVVDNNLIQIANNKIITWDFSLSYFLKSVFCGMIMHICVDLYKKKKCIFGILYGVPLFIFCGFQHCIANIILLGIARRFSFTILLCIIGNLIGGIISSILTE